MIMKTCINRGLKDSQREVKERLRLLGVLNFALAVLGCNDMKPPRPYAVPFDVSAAGYTQTIDFEVLEKEVGIGLVLMLYHSNRAQRDYLQAKVCEDPKEPTLPLSFTNPSTGVIIPIRVRLINDNTVLFDEVLQTQACFSRTAGDVGWFDRNVYGRVLSQGKYRYEIQNLQAQPAFNGYRQEIRIPGDRKV